MHKKSIGIKIQNNIIGKEVSTIYHSGKIIRTIKCPGPLSVLVNLINLLSRKPKRFTEWMRSPWKNIARKTWKHSALIGSMKMRSKMVKMVVKCFSCLIIKQNIVLFFITTKHELHFTHHFQHLTLHFHRTNQSVKDRRKWKGKNILVLIKNKDRPQALVEKWKWITNK